MNKKEIVLSFDLFCSWDNTPPVYRIFIDNELIVERTYIWKKPDYVRENLVLLLEPGTHFFYIQSLFSKDIVQETNITINGLAVSGLKNQFTI